MLLAKKSGELYDNLVKWKLLEDRQNTIKNIKEDLKNLLETDDIFFKINDKLVFQNKVLTNKINSIFIKYYHKNLFRDYNLKITNESFDKYGAVTEINILLKFCKTNQLRLVATNYKLCYFWKDFLDKLFSISFEIKIKNNIPHEVSVKCLNENF
jgi:hypothetical protein